jgi:hypothetical protein
MPGYPGHNSQITLNSHLPTMQFRSICSLVILVCLALIFAGCTGSPSSGSPAAGSSPDGSSASVQNNLVVSPTEALPSQNVVAVTVGEKDYLGNIPVTFDGGMGQVHVKKIDVTVYRADGQTKTATLNPNKGDSVDVEGTKQTDRVVVYISFDNGDRKKTNDVLSPYRTRQ